MFKNFLKLFFCVFVLTATIFFAVSSFGFDSFSLAPGLAKAIPLHNNLDPSLPITDRDQTWIFTNGSTPGVWHVCLGLANAFAALVLLFFAVVNIAHIQYDTYEIKKALPFLILGTVLANFSMFICRMLVDFAQVLAITFVNQTNDFFKNLFCSFMVQSGSVTVNYFANSFSIQLALLVSVILLIIIFIVSFLLFIRQIVILVLAAVSPLAFVMMGFTLTSGLFKQWIGWLLRWVFMGPVAISLIWVASVVGATNCKDTRNFVAFLLSMGLMVAAIFVPFKLGGAVMAAWGGIGKKIAGAGGNAAWNNPWAKAKRAETTKNLAGWWGKTRIGKSMDEARQAEAWHKGDMEETAAERGGDALDRWRQGKGFFSNAGDRARRQIGLKRVKEQVGDLDLKSREGLSKAFEIMEHNGDDKGAKALMEMACEQAMLADVMQEASTGIQQKYGAGLLKEKTDLDGNIMTDNQGRTLYEFKTGIDEQQEFARRVVMGLSTEGQKTKDWTQGKDDLETRNRLQEAWEKSGINGAKTIVKDESAPDGLRELKIGQREGMEAVDQDIAKHTHMMNARAASPHSRKKLQNARKEVMFDSNKKVSRQGIAFLKGLTKEDIRELRTMRTNALELFNQEGNIEQLEAAGLFDIVNQLETMGYGKRSAPNSVVLGVQDQRGEVTGTREVKIQDLDATLTTNAQVQNSILQRVQNSYTPGETRKIKRVGPGGQEVEVEVNAIEQLATEVQNNNHFTPAFQAHVNGVARLRLAENDAKKLQTASATEGEALVQRIGQTMQDEVGNALNNHIDIMPIVDKVISSVKEGPTQIILKEKVKEAMAVSNATVISPSGVDIKASDIIRIYNRAKEGSRPGQRPTDDEIKLRFSGLIKNANTRIGDQAHQISPDEMDRAWRLVEAYEFKKPPKKTNESARERLVDIMAAQERDARNIADEEGQP